MTLYLQYANLRVSWMQSRRGGVLQPNLTNSSGQMSRHGWNFDKGPEGPKLGGYQNFQQ